MCSRAPLAAWVASNSASQMEGPGPPQQQAAGHAQQQPEPLRLHERVAGGPRTRPRQCRPASGANGKHDAHEADKDGDMAAEPTASAARSWGMTWPSISVSTVLNSITAIWPTNTSPGQRHRAPHIVCEAHTGQPRSA